jgi:hypothetical protein
LKKEEMERVFHENLRTKDEIANRLTEAGFTLRAGYFREG